MGEFFKYYDGFLKLLHEINKLFFGIEKTEKIHQIYKSVNKERKLQFN